MRTNRSFIDTVGLRLRPAMQRFLRERFSRDEAFKFHEAGRLTDEAHFERLRLLLGINLPNAEFLEGWNAIFVGEGSLTEAARSKLL